MIAEFPETETPQAGYPLLQQAAAIDDSSHVTRCLPHAVGPEKAVLSVMLQYPEEFIPKAVEARITREHFYLPSNAILFDVFLTIFEACNTIETVRLIQHLQDHGQMDRIGGPSTIADIMTYQPSPGYWESHVGMLREKRVLRQLLEVSHTAIDDVYATPEDALELLSEVETKLLAIRETDRPSAGMSTGKDAMASVLAECDDLCAGKASARGMATGFAELDRMSNGLKPGEMFVIAARPSMGKTALMMNIVEHVCIELDVPSVVFSCEMTTHQLGSRLCYSRARFHAQKLMRGEKPDRGELMSIQRAAMAISAAKLVIDETSAITISELRAKARRLHREGRAGLIAVDYLQLLRSNSRQASGSREREISEISAGLKALAKELMVPVIVVAQLNRESEKRPGKGETRGMPRMSDLRESGSTEQDADIVALLHRPEYFAEDDEARETSAGVANLIIAKNRGGNTGKVALTWIAQQVRFEDGLPAAEQPYRQAYLPNRND